MCIRDSSKGAIVVEVDVTGPDFEVPGDVFIAMNLIHGTFGEDGQIQAILEQRGIRYTGAGVTSSRIAFDKLLSKERFIAAGVPTPLSQPYPPVSYTHLDVYKRQGQRFARRSLDAHPRERCLAKSGADRCWRPCRRTDLA